MTTINVETGKLVHRHTDSRRSLSDFNGSDFSVQSFIISDDPKPLANHYHKEKQEIFVITSGAGTFAYCAVDENGLPVGEPETLHVEAASVLCVRSFTAHAFLLEPGSTMICYSSKPFDPADMHVFKLI